MSDKDHHQPDLSRITLPYRIRRDGWWLDEHPVTRWDVIRVAPKLVLINGRQQKEDDRCKKPAR